jgi:histone-lysine N-methyltransferase SETDB1
LRFVQVFKTAKRGWGLRTLCDIPHGNFICIYVGNLYTNESANELGKDMGDEYFAELDLIEAVERNKDGYESDVEDDDVRN